jgi:hypothetical protein
MHVCLDARYSGFHQFAPVRPIPDLGLALCFLVMAADGFDTAAGHLPPVAILVRLFS